MSYLGMGFMYSRMMWKSPLCQSLSSAPTANISQAAFVMPDLRRNSHGLVSARQEAARPNYPPHEYRSRLRGAKYVASPSRLVSSTAETAFPAISRENVMKAAKLGRLATHSPEAQARRSETQRRQNAARNSWNPTSNPAWLSEQFYKDHIQGQLRRVQVPVIQRDLPVSEPYALRICSGRCIPHPRHWQSLAKLVRLAGRADAGDDCSTVTH